MAHCFKFGVIRSTVIGLAMVLVLVLGGCANQEVFTAVDNAKCRQLGFTPGSNDYDTCLSQVARRHTDFDAVPEPLREDYTAAISAAPTATPRRDRQDH
jgi:outer membrane murein-binding lipoprotein Lpp